MIVSPTLSPLAAQSAEQLSTPAATGSGSFVAALASATQPPSSTDAASNAHRSFRSGQLSIDMHADGQRINSVSYFDPSGQKLTSSGFWPQDILRQCERFNIPLSDLKGLGPQLESAGVLYKPYEQYAGTGSNHGIDLDDLASGGMGTAYDWTQDPLVHLKGPSALGQLEADQALAKRLGLRPVSSAVGSVSSTGHAAPAAKMPAPPTPSESLAVDTTNSSARTVKSEPAATSSHAAQAMSALDELLRLITQVKTSLQYSSTVQTGTTDRADASASSSGTSLPGTTPAKASGLATASPVTASQDPTAAHRLGQMKSLLEQLLAQR